jgi:hypothetical protein
MPIVFMAIMFIIPDTCTCQETNVIPHSTAALSLPADMLVSANDAKKMPGSSVWGEINVGYSNYGMAGEATINYRQGNKLFSVGYYKSHLCYNGFYDGLFFPKAGACENHITITSYRVSRGIMLPGKLCPSISCGISLTEFSYQNTTPIKNDFGLSSFWGIASGNDYDDGVLRTQTRIVIGVPVEFKVHLAQTHNIGFDAGTKVDLNADRIVISAMFGIRFGKVVKTLNH